MPTYKKDLEGALEAAAYALARAQGSISVFDLKKLTVFKEAEASSYLIRQIILGLEKDGLLEARGEKRSRRYFLVAKDEPTA